MVITNPPMESISTRETGQTGDNMVEEVAGWQVSKRLKASGRGAYCSKNSREYYTVYNR
jgi:hypothetical protein